MTLAWKKKVALYDIAAENKRGRRLRKSYFSSSVHCAPTACTLRAEGPGRPAIRVLAEHLAIGNADPAQSVLVRSARAGSRAERL